MGALIERINGLVWGMPLILMISLIGIILSFRMRFVQVRRLGRALRLTVQPADADTDGAVSGFGALATSLAAMIGTGNIVGVATAVAAGGPGAVVWMVIAAFFGMATTYAEGLLAVKFRKVAADGHIVGGAFAYIERGMGKRFRWLACLFAFFGAAAALLGIGTMSQVNGMANAVVGLSGSAAARIVHIFGMQVPLPALLCAVVVTVLVGIVVFGGIGRISKVATVVVPVMGTFFVLATISVLVVRWDAVPVAVGKILSCAFTGHAALGGFSGVLVSKAIRMGVSRGIFSNEAGMGSASIAAAAAKTKQPAEQGLISMTGTFIDTIVLCTLTGVAIVVSGVLDTGSGLNGVALTSAAYNVGTPYAPGLGGMVVSVSLIFFAFTSVLGWNYYGEQCVEYLGGRKWIGAYRVCYLAAVFFGCFLELDLVWNVADIFNGLMAVPNLTALFSLSGIVVRETQKYERSLRDQR